MFSSPPFLLPLLILFMSLGLELGFPLPPNEGFERRVLSLRMNGLNLDPVLDLSIPSSRPPLKRKWGLKRCEGNKKERPVLPKWITIGDLESVRHLRGSRTTHLGFPPESITPQRRNKKETPQVGEAAAFKVSDRLIQGTTDPSSRSIEQNATGLSLGHVGNIRSSEHIVGITGPCFSWKQYKEYDPFVLNAAVTLSSLGKNPSLHRFKILGQMQSADALACDSTTGPVEESEAMRKWKEIKENGFLSYPHGGMPTSPQQHGKKSKKKVGRKRKMETAKREQANMFKSAPSSGLLSGINTGIIRRVRNHKEVHAILEAMVRPEKPDAQMRNEFTGLVESGSKEISDTMKDQNQFTQSPNGPSVSPSSEQNGKTIESDTAEERFHTKTAATSHCSDNDKKLKLPSAVTTTSDIATRGCDVDFSVEQALNRPSVPPSSEQSGKSLESDNAEEKFPCETATISQCFSDHNKKLPLAVTTSSDITTRACDGDFSAEQENIFSLSKKGATYAFQWLEFLQQDIKGRLLTLRRSKKRVTDAIQKKLPHLASTELPYIETGPRLWQSSGAWCLSRWMAIFNQLHSTLCEEEELLENNLRNVEGNLLHCEMSLKSVNRDSLPQFGSSEDFRSSKKAEDLASQRAVQAAAAALYSTCNLIMRKRAEDL